VPQWKKRKVVKEVAIQALTEEYLDKIGNQVKEVTDDVFQCATQQHEEMHQQMQERMDELHQLLEAANIMPW
jgi:phosphate uptake regulator